MMLKLQAIFFTAFLSVCCGADWSYDDQGNWPGLCKTGKNQSPININETSARNVGNLNALKLYFNSSYLYPLNLPINVNVTNNDNKVNVEPVPADRQLILDLRHPKRYKYVFESMHFHTPAEHTVSNARFPLESHMIFRRQDFQNLAEALNEPEGVAVLGTFYQIGSCNMLLNDFFTSIPKAGQSIIMSLRPLSFVPKRFPYLSYYTYFGSLTTPDCTEGIRWIVFKEPISISNKQLETFKLMGNNARKLQDLNGRVLEFNRAIVFPV